MAGIVSTVAGRNKDKVPFEIVIAVAWLHDTVEDTDVTIDDIKNHFGETITEGVTYLTDVEIGNRVTRKRLANIRLGNSPGWVQDIKVADLLSNMKNIAQFDKAFAPVFFEECWVLLNVLTKADPELLAFAKAQWLIYKQTFNLK